MRDAPVGPRQRRALERPADGDPLMVQLKRNRDGGKAERSASDQRQPPEVALTDRFHLQ